eukprot:g8101.t1
MASQSSGQEFSLELYPTERKYSVAHFDGVVELDFSGAKTVRMGLQDVRDDEGDEDEHSEAAAGAGAEGKPQAGKKKRPRRARAPLSKKWVASDARAAYEGSVVPTNRSNDPSAYVLLVPVGPRAFHVVPVDERVHFRKPAPRGMSLEVADMQMKEVKARQRRQALKYGLIGNAEDGASGGGGRGRPAADPFDL